MSDFNEIILFDKKTLSDLFKEIYKNTKKTEERIEDLIMALKPFINSPAEAVMIVPLITEYLDIQVKNNEHLVKMAAVVQRAMNNSAAAGSDSLIISDEEKEQLLLTMREMDTAAKQLNTPQPIPQLENVKKNKK
jgi:hypothetical protein